MNAETIALRESRIERGGERRPLRILDITKFYSHASGGVRTYLDAKVRDFAERDVAHSLVIPDERASVTTVGNTRIHRVPGPIIPVAPNYRLLTSVRAIEQILDIEQPDLIEVGSPFLVPVLVRRAIRNRNIRTVGFYHSDLVRTYAEPYVTKRLAAPLRVAARNLARAYVCRVYRRFDVTVAASRAVAGELRSLGISHVHTVSLGVDLDVFTPDGPAALLRRQLGVPERVPIAIYAGRFCSEKRLDVVLAAHAQIAEPERPHLVLVGDGQHRSMLESESRRRSGLSVLPYERDRARLAALFRAADCYIAPGPGETFGLAIAEALACGLPVVAVAMGAAPDRVAGTECGRFYRHGDVTSCRDALLAMTATVSPELRAAARAHAEAHFGWRSTFDALFGLYESLAPVRT